MSEPEIDEAITKMLANASRQSELAAPAVGELEKAAPVLIAAMRHDTGQSERVRQIVWSLYGCSQLVPLGHVCSGLDFEIAEALAAAVTARLLVGPEIEPILKSILSAAGEFERYDRATADQERDGLPTVYPLPMTSGGELRDLAAALEHHSESNLKKKAHESV